MNKRWRIEFYNLGGSVEEIRKKSDERMFNLNIDFAQIIGLTDEDLQEDDFDNDELLITNIYDEYETV